MAPILPFFPENPMNRLAEKAWETIPPEQNHISTVSTTSGTGTIDRDSREGDHHAIEIPHHASRPARALAHRRCHGLARTRYQAIESASAALVRPCIRGAGRC